ncbi:RNA polymerase subunit sigma [Streptomyces sp. NPDC050804]|uniref:RNA polymerase subunit sigma n=1 Tax=Streptomyces sp. NPDC050804 TaxID=3154745 RepID=UPI0034173AD9
MEAGEALPIAELVDERRFLLDVAHWMLGGAGEAEGVVDETYRRWYGLSGPVRRRIVLPRSWLVRTAGGISLGRLTPPARTADEPSTAAGAGAGAGSAELADPACHCLWARRSRHTSPEQYGAVAREVRQACLTQDAGLLASLLCPDATAFFDGGGKVRALVRPVHGGRQVAHSLLTLLVRRPRTTLTAQSVNGRTGLVARYDHQVAAVISLDIADHHITRVRAVLNPDKLRLWNQRPSPGVPSSRQGPAQRGDGWS